MTIIAVGGDVNDSSNGPDDCELAGSPNATDSVTSKESNQGSSNATNLNHSGDIARLLGDSAGIRFVGQYLQAIFAYEALLRDCAGNQTFVKSTSGTLQVLHQLLYIQ